MPNQTAEPTITITETDGRIELFRWRVETPTGISHFPTRGQAEAYADQYRSYWEALQFTK